VEFIRDHADCREPGGLRWGVEPICAVLSEHGCKIAPSTYYEHVVKSPTRRAQREQVLLGHVRRVHAENYSVYGARKVWLQLNREPVVVARCTVERLMAADGLQGAVRGKVKRTTTADPAAERARDLVGRVFTPAAPDTLWVADMTSRRGRGGCTSRSSSTPSPAGSWVGARGPACPPSWSWTPWSRRCGPDNVRVLT
jgi:putative transposase